MYVYEYATNVQIVQKKKPRETKFGKCFYFEIPI